MHHGSIIEVAGASTGTCTACAQRPSTATLMERRARYVKHAACKCSARRAVRGTLHASFRAVCVAGCSARSPSHLLAPSVPPPPSQKSEGRVQGLT
eukprot:7303704-Lingulodinium_polyedra.AAC.1